MPRDEKPRWSIALASREVWPFVEGGGIGRCVWAVARLLAPHADVTVVTSANWRERYEALAASGDPRLPEGVQFAFAPEPEGDLAPFVSWHHAWSTRLLEGIAAAYPAGGPDLVEVADYQGEGFALAHAIRGRDPRLRNTRLIVRLSTSAEICAVLNETPGDGGSDLMRGIERFPLRFADVLLWPGGDALAYYERFYGEDGLAASVRSALPTADDMLPQTDDTPAPAGDGPVRLLFLNRLERRKGIEEIISAVRALPDAEVELTIVGGDTSTGPDGGSMRAHVGDLAGDDPRIAFADQVPHEQVPALIAAHDVVVIPSRWETFSYVTREALAANRPVLATPSGAIADVVIAGRSGWLARSSAVEDLVAALEQLLAERNLLATMIAQRSPRAVFDESQTNDEQVETYRQIVAAERPAATTARTAVDAIVALDGSGTGLDRTLRSLVEQRDAEPSSIVVLADDQPIPGPLELARITHLVERTARNGRPAAWADGLGAGGAEHVLLLPAGTVLERGFLARTLEILVAEPAVDYVTAFVDGGTLPWHAPLGSYELPLDAFDAGASVAVFRRAALSQLLSLRPQVRDEATLYATAARGGVLGLVLQEPLVRHLPKRPRAVPS